MSLVAEIGRLRRVADHVRVIASVEDRARLVAELGLVTKPTVVSFVNAHGANLACRDEGFCGALLRSDVLLRDGSGMRMLYQSLGRDPGLNMNGTDFIPELIAALPNAPIALCGTEEPYLSKTASLFGPRVALAVDGFREPESYAAAVAKSGAKIVVLAMGMPKQETVAMHLQEHLQGGVVIVNGGAVVDFLAGRFPRAPQWVRAVGMEWLYRLIREPRRLSSRYVVGNPLFLWRVAHLRLRRPA